MPGTRFCLPTAPAAPGWKGRRAQGRAAASISLVAQRWNVGSCSSFLFWFTKDDWVISSYRREMIVGDFWYCWSLDVNLFLIWSVLCSDDWEVLVSSDSDHWVISTGTMLQLSFFLKHPASSKGRVDSSRGQLEVEDKTCSAAIVSCINQLAVRYFRDKFWIQACHRGTFSSRPCCSGAFLASGCWAVLTIKVWPRIFGTGCGRTEAPKTKRKSQGVVPGAVSCWWDQQPTCGDRVGW